MSKSLVKVLANVRREWAHIAICMLSMGSVHTAWAAINRGHQDAFQQWMTLLFMCFEVVNSVSMVIILVRMGQIPGPRLADVDVLVAVIGNPLRGYLGGAAMGRVFWQGKVYLLRHLGNIIPIALMTPPAHALFVWALTTPIYIMFDMQQRLGMRDIRTHNCLDSTVDGASCPIDSDAMGLGSGQYKWTTGLNFLTVSFFCGLLSSIIAIKFEAVFRPGLGARADNALLEDLQPVDPPLPFSSFGLSYEGTYSIRTLGNLLRLVKPCLAKLSDKIEESLIATTICLPVCLYYMFRIQIARISAEDYGLERITPDEWLCFAIAFFILGRESSKSDRFLIFALIQNKLLIAQEVLLDLLPSHLVKTMFQREPTEAKIDGENASSVSSTAVGTGASAGLTLEAVTQTQTTTHTINRNHRFSLSGGGDIPLPPLPSHEKLCENHDCVTIFFSDIIGFSSWSSTVPPERVMLTLNDLYCRMDSIILNELPQLYKMETIGDAYMVAANLTSAEPAHAAVIIRFALRVQEEAAKVPRPDVDDGSTLRIRIGIHSGPVTSGIVGKIRRRYCLFGDTVNMASRTETSCPPGCIQVTQSARDLALPVMASACTDAELVERGPVEVKGAAKPIMMFLASRVIQHATESPPDGTYSI